MVVGLDRGGEVDGVLDGKELELTGRLDLYRPWTVHAKRQTWTFVPQLGAKERDGLRSVGEVHFVALFDVRHNSPGCHLSLEPHLNHIRGSETR